MIDLITGHQGMPHISAKQISDINNAMMEGYGADKVMRMKDGTITLSNDTFKVNPGYWRVNGYDMEIQETESITIERTTGNLKRYDDIYVEILRDIPSGAERAELVKVVGTPASSSPSHPAAPTEPELTTDTLLLCIPVGYVYVTSSSTSKHDDTVAYHYVSETEYIELLTHLQQEQYSRARMSSGNFAPIRVEDIIKLNTKGTWTHTDPSSIGGYANDTYTLDSGNIVFQISSNGLGLNSILVSTSSTSGYTEKLILFKGEVAISSNNLWLPRNGSQVPSGLSAAAIVNGEEYSVGTGGYYVELPDGVLTELYIQATSGISGNTKFYPTIRYKDDPTYTSSYPPAPTNIMLWNEINDVKKDLLSEMSDNAPYLLRKGKGNLADIVLEGYSLPVNQLVQNGNFESTSGWNATNGTISVRNNVLSYTVSTVGTVDYSNIVSKNLSLKANHKYLIEFDLKRAHSGAPKIYIVNSAGSNVGVSFATASTPTNWNRYSKVVSLDSGSFWQVQIALNCTSANGYSVGDVEQLRNIVIHDITAMFRTDIADHIYSKEQATAGSGIAWIKSYGFFSKDYEPYNAGSIQSVKTSGRKVVGFNQWDEEWEVGRFNDTTGAKEDGFSNTIRSKNYIRVMPNTQYKNFVVNTTDLVMYIFYYDADKNFISKENRYCNVQSTPITTPSNTCYMMFYLQTSYGTSYKHDICINISDTTKNGTYEPYTSTTVALPNEDLRGILKRDGDNLYADGDTDIGIGNKNVRFGIVDLGTLDYVYEAPLMRASITGIVKPNASTKANIITPKYVTMSQNGIVNGGIAALSYTNGVIIQDSNYTDAATFKTAMNGVYLVYEVATPTTESSIPWQNPQRAYLDGTEEFIDERDVPIPVGNVSKYTSSEILSPAQDYVDGAVNSHEHATVLWELPEDFDYTNLPSTIQLSGDLSQYDYIQAVICHGLYNNKIEGGMEIITFKDTGADTGNISETAIENYFNNFTSYVTKITRYREFSYSNNSKTFGMSDNCYKITHKYTKTNPVETLEDFTIYNGSSYYYMLYPIKIIGYKYK